MEEKPFHAKMPPPTLDPDPEEHTEKRSAGRAGEHKGRERGQALAKKKL
jgi:hypothetical protein